VAEPNPIWGLHLAPGALAGALVRRTDTGHEVLETFTSPAPSDAAGLRAAAVDVLARRGVRGRAALVAAADHDCTVRTGQIPSEELYLNDEEIFHQLHDFAPFEPGDGHLTYVTSGHPDARRFLLAGIPLEAHAGIEALALALDGRYHGIGLATSSLFRGARALGLVAERGFVVHVQARLTSILAIDADKLRRYLLPVGIEQAEESVETAALLANDILRTTAYHVEQGRREALAEGADRIPDIVFVGPTAQRARQLLSPALGPRLAGLGARDDSASDVTGVDGAPLGDAEAHACVGAVGAALEAFRTSDARLVLRHPPVDVPEYQEGGPRRWMGIAAAVLIAGGLAFAGWTIFGNEGREDPTKTVARGSAPLTDGSQQPDDAALTATAARGALADLARREIQLRCYLAVLAAERSSSPPHAAQDLSISAMEDLTTTTHEAVVTLAVEGRLSLAVEVNAREAAEAVAGIGNVRVTAESHALRILFDVDSPPLPDAGDGDRLLEPRLLRGPSDTPASTQRAPTAGFVAGGVQDEEQRWQARDGAAVALTAPEAEYAAARFEAIDRLIEFLPSLAASSMLTDVRVADCVATVEIAPPVRARATLQRRRVPEGDWEDAVAVEVGASSVLDHIAGGSGTYAWRLVFDGADTTPVIESDVVIEVEIELTEVTPTTESAAFTLRRSFRGDQRECAVRIAVGELISGTSDDARLHFHSGLRLASIVERTETEAVTRRVPRFLPSGRIERDTSGAPILVAQPGERTVTFVEVTAEDAAGEARRWVRKMTDR